MSISLNNVNSEVVRAHTRLDLLDFKTITNVSGVKWANKGTYNLTTPLNPSYNFINVIVEQFQDDYFTSFLRIPYKYKSKKFVSCSHDEYTLYTFPNDNQITITDFYTSGDRQGVIKEIFQSNVYYTLDYKPVTSIDDIYKIDKIKRGDILWQ